MNHNDLKYIIRKMQKTYTHYGLLRRVGCSRSVLSITKRYQELFDCKKTREKYHIC